MFQYLSKFLIQILPSVTATVIGGFIVHTWIMPKATGDAPRPAIASKASPDSAGAAEAKTDKPLTIKGVAMSPKVPPKEAGLKETASAATDDKAEDATLRDAVDAIAADADSRQAAKPASPEKPAASDKAASPAAEKPKLATAPASDDKRNASDLARTALERLRAGDQPRADHGKPAETAKPAVIDARASEPQRIHSNPPVVEPVQSAAPQPVVLPMGPPINIAAPRFSEPTANEETHPGDARMVPPGEIPTVHRTAEAADGRTNIADEFVSATRSMLRAVLPK